MRIGDFEQWVLRVRHLLILGFCCYCLLIWFGLVWFCFVLFSFKKSSNGQRGQSRLAFTVANSEPTVAVTASHSVQNASHVQSQLPGMEPVLILE